MHSVGKQRATRHLQQKTRNISPSLQCKRVRPRPATLLAPRSSSRSAAAAQPTAWHCGLPASPVAPAALRLPPALPFAVQPSPSTGTTATIISDPCYSPRTHLHTHMPDTRPKLQLSNPSRLSQLQPSHDAARASDCASSAVFFSLAACFWAVCTAAYSFCASSLAALAWHKQSTFRGCHCFSCWHCHTLLRHATHVSHVRCPGSLTVKGHSEAVISVSKACRCIHTGLISQPAAPWTATPSHPPHKHQKRCR